jgi:hypothetical protein
MGRRNNRKFILLTAVLCGAPLLAPAPAAGQQQPAVRPASQVEEMTSDSFTELLKQVWTFLQTETESYRTSVARKDEFETTAEYEQRIADRQRQYLANIVKYSRAEKLHTRSFWVPFKAGLLTYDADRQVYQVASVGIVEAPYNIPTVQTVVRPNPYLALADSIRRGYRTSTLYLNFKPSFSWNVSPAEARAAKAEEESLAFRVRVMIDIESMESREQASQRVVPLEIQFLNTKSNKIYWQQQL